MLPKSVPSATSLMDLFREGKQNSHAPSAHSEYQALHGSSNQECMSFHLHSKSAKEISNAHCTDDGRTEKETGRQTLGEEQEFSLAREGAG